MAYRPGEFVIDVDGETVTTAAYNVVVANSGFYGKGMHIAPMASIDDGLLDVVVIPAESRLKMIRLFPKVYDGSHVDIPGVQTFTGREITLSLRQAGGPEGMPGTTPLSSPSPTARRSGRCP